MPTNEPLKPCPWCATSEYLKAISHSNGMWNWWSVDCLKCEATGPQAISEGTCCRLWNQREGEK